MYCRGKDNFYRLDFRIAKFFSFSKSMDIEVTFEVFNVFNTVNFRGYQGDVSVPETLGQPSYTTMPREAQPGIRFRF